VIAGDVLASANASAGMAALRQADRQAGMASSAFRAHDYAGAFDHAKAAFDLAKAAAHRSGVRVRASSAGWFVLSPVRPVVAVDESPDYAHIDKLSKRAHRTRG